MPTLTVLSPKQTLHLSVPSNRSVRAALDNTDIRVRAACGGNGACGACLIQWLDGEVNPPTLVEYQRLSPEQRNQGQRLACQLRLLGDATLKLEHPAHASVWSSLADDLLSDLPPSQPQLEHAIYGLAVDLGTTHLRLTLWDRKKGRRIASRRGLNPQATFGADILNRLHASVSSPDNANRLRDLLREAIIDGLRDILARDVGEIATMLPVIGKVCLVGNSAMLALLIGEGADALLKTETGLEPIEFQIREQAQWRDQWQLPHANFHLGPAIGGFVGSDLSADILATRLIDGNGPALLLDVGTNTELCLWDGQNIHVASVPGGPAFEGVGIRHGMSAEPGAIYRLCDHDGEIRAQVLGGGEARGFCGSGLIDAVALLLERGRLKPSGRFVGEVPTEGVFLLPGQMQTALFPGDIDALQRAKAAIAAAIIGLLQHAGCSWHDLQRLCLCGAFGRHLDVAHAQRIGLLPMIPVECIELHADAALLGCEMALLAEDDPFQRLTSFYRLHALSGNERYDDSYINQLRLMPIIEAG